jgi:hypothetical protein
MGEPLLLVLIKIPEKLPEIVVKFDPLHHKGNIAKPEAGHITIQRMTIFFVLKNSTTIKPELYSP